MEWFVQQLSDSLLKELLNNPYTRCARNLSILCKENILIISGEVSSFYQKQMVQEILRKMLLGRDIHLKNDLCVEYGAVRNSQD
jgi:hypothetical protein